VAFVAGLLVFPVIYSFALQDAVSASTIGTLFIAVPSAFQAMGAVGRVVGLVFFLVLALGAITSTISLLEVVTASVMDEYGLSRRRAALLAGTAITLLGVVPAFDIDVLSLMDKVVGEFLLLAGGLVLAVALSPSTVGSRRVGVLLVVAAELAIVGTVWMIAAQANMIGDSFLSWGAVADTQSGQWWIARLVVIALFCVLIPLRTRLVVRGALFVVGALAIGMLGVVAAGGHAISGDSLVVGFVATVVHLAAMSIWLGGLAVVLVAPRPGEFWSTVRRFSPWALGSVVALAVTGTVNAWRQLGSIDDLTDSSYGRWLVIKLVLVVLVVGVAAFSRRVVQTRGDDASVIVRRSVGVEIAGVALILGATAGLVNSPPPTDAPEIVSVSAVVGDRVAQVELEPAVTGGTEMHVYVTSPSGALDSADEITVTAGLPDQDIPPFEVEVFPAGLNHVVSTDVNLPVAGLWTFEVTARYGEFDEVVFTVQVPVSD